MAKSPAALGTVTKIRIVWTVVVALQLILNHVGKQCVLVGLESLAEVGLSLGYGFGHAGKGMRSLKPRKVSLGHGSLRLRLTSVTNPMRTRFREFPRCSTLSLVWLASKGSSRPHERSCAVRVPCCHSHSSVSLRRRSGLPGDEDNVRASGEESRQGADVGDDL